MKHIDDTKGLGFPSFKQENTGTMPPPATDYAESGTAAWMMEADNAQAEIRETAQLAEPVQEPDWMRGESAAEPVPPPPMQEAEPEEDFSSPVVEPEKEATVAHEDKKDGCMDMDKKMGERKTEDFWLDTIQAAQEEGCALNYFQAQAIYLVGCESGSRASLEQAKKLIDRLLIKAACGV